MPRGKRIHQPTAGTDLRQVTKCRRGPSPDKDPEYAGYGFADVRRACHRFLMERDEHYRRDRHLRDSLKNNTASAS